MAQDVSEKIDEYCLEKYGHTNWGYISSYEDHELEHAQKCGATYDVDNDIIFWHHSLNDDEEEGDK